MGSVVTSGYGSTLIAALAALTGSLYCTSSASADTYDVASIGNGTFYVRNRDTNTGIITQSYAEALNEQISDLTSLQYADPNLYGSGPTVTLDRIKVSGISGDILHLSSTDAAIQGVVEWNGEPAYIMYGVNFDYNVVTGEITNTTLTAYTADDYTSDWQRGEEVARALGFNVDTTLAPMPDTAYSFESYTENFLNEETGTNGGLISSQLTSQDGTSIVRQEDNGTVHLGENSLVFAERGVAGFSEDTVFSSNGVLHIGDSSSHRTVVNGTLEIQDPTAPNHAATKRYADSSAALAMAMSSLPRSANGNAMIGFGSGFLGGESAFAFGFSQSDMGSGFSVNVNLGYSDATDVGGAVGFGYEF